MDREQIRSFHVYLIQEKKLDPGTITVVVSAIRFLYEVTLLRQWNFDKVILTPKKPRRLPVIFSPEEILQFLNREPAVKHRAILTTCYAKSSACSSATWTVSAWSFAWSRARDRKIATTGAVEQACQRAHRLGPIAKPITPHSLRTPLPFLC